MTYIGASLRPPPPAAVGQMYLDFTSGEAWVWDGVRWVPLATWLFGDDDPGAECNLDD